MLAIAARRGGRDSVPGWSSDHFWEVNTCYPSRWEDRCPGQVRSRLLLKKWPFHPGYPDSRALRRKKHFFLSQLQISVTVSSEKLSGGNSVGRKAPFSSRTCVSCCSTPLGWERVGVTLYFLLSVCGAKSSRLNLARPRSCFLCVASRHDIRWSYNSQKTPDAVVSVSVSRGPSVALRPLWQRRTLETHWSRPSVSQMRVKHSGGCDSARS